MTFVLLLAVKKLFSLFYFGLTPSGVKNKKSRKAKSQ